MFSKLLFFILVIPVLVTAQNCKITLSGCIIHAKTGLPISYANIVTENHSTRAISDSNGFFKLLNICPVKTPISIHSLGYINKSISLEIQNDTFVTIYLHNLSYTLEDITVSGNSSPSSTQNTTSLNRADITANANKNLSNLLENIAGVSVLKNGNDLSKPVVHGLYGNRLMILNNGIVQAGQQWGNDHSPEIDPMVANQISVVKGAAALEYQGSSLGSFILVEPQKINSNKKLNGQANYHFESNGFGHGLNLQLQMNHDWFAWKLTGTIKKKGDRYTPSYFLRNTGNQEANFALQVEKKISSKWFANLYISSFNSDIGILRGSHIGNLTDLRSALVQPIPFFTVPYFSYQIEAPFQRVNHHLAKLNSRYYIDSKQYIDFTYSSQWNNRKEFDVRRSNYTEKPALSLSQFSHFIEGKYLNYFDNGLQLKGGVQGRIIDNTNNPETGILPLIPDYFSYETGLFVLLTKKHKKFFIELGGRYDFIHQAIAAISVSVPRKIVRYNNNFHTFNLLAGLVYRPNKKIKLWTNIGSASRNPGINELYSAGLHQGVSGIEEGNLSLKTELSVKTTLGLELNINDKFWLETSLYYQWIDNFIYLNPQQELRLTIRGAFPVYRYEQTLAQIYGIDLSATYLITPKLKLKAQYSYLRGDDLGNKLPLINMPANNVAASLNYTFPKVGSFKNLNIALNNRYVFKQNHLLSSQDFAPVPEAYNLLGISLSIEKAVAKYGFKFYIKVDNLLNTRYRDYLNRQRYFSDDLGINGTVGLSFTF